MDGWTDGQTQADDGWMDGWMLSVCFSPHTLNVVIVAALTAARAFAVFKNRITSESNQIPDFRSYILKK